MAASSRRRGGGSASLASPPPAPSGAGLWWAGVSLCWPVSEMCAEGGRVTAPFSYPDRTTSPSGQRRHARGPRKRCLPGAGVLNGLGLADLNRTPTVRGVTQHGSAALSEGEGRGGDAAVGSLAHKMFCWNHTEPLPTIFTVVKRTREKCSFL